MRSLPLIKQNKPGDDGAALGREANSHPSQSGIPVSAGTVSEATCREACLTNKTKIVRGIS